MKQLVTVLCMSYAVAAFASARVEVPTLPLEATWSDMVTTVNYHRYAKQSSAELIAEGAIS